MLPRLILALAILIATTAVLAQAPANPASKPDPAKKPPGNCTVSGRVISAAEGSPLRSARVGLIQANERKHPQVYAATTDNEGHFEIKQIGAGRYEFFASHSGYLGQHYQAKGTESGGEGAELSLTSGQVVNDVVFRLVRAGVITGRVVDDAGEPMANVNVSVLHRPTEEEREEWGMRAKKMEMTGVSVGTTDDRGEYRIHGLKPGVYYLKATETDNPNRGMTQAEDDYWLLQELGSEFAPIYYPGVLQLDQAQAVVIGAGEEAQADFAMRRVKMTQVSGKVIGPDGTPAAHTYVQLYHPGVGDWGGESGVGSDSSGEFSIKGVSPGNYVLSAGMRDKDRYYNTQQKIQVGEAKVEGLVLVLGGGATIHGRIRTASGTALPSGRFWVHLSPAEEDSMGFGQAEVNKDGSFEVGGIGDGSYILAASGMDGEWFMKSAHLGNEDVLQNGVQVEGGAAKGSLDIVMSNEGGQIEGAVKDSEKEQALAGIQVKASPDPPSDYNSRRSRSSTTDQNGHYVLKDVPPGKYKVSAKIASPADGVPSVKSEAIAVSVGEREHRTLDISIKVPSSE